MKMDSINRWIVLTLLLSIATTCVAQSQEPPPPPPGPRGGRDGGPPPPPKETPEQRLQMQIHELLGSNDDEWQVLQPKIEQIQLLLQQRDRYGKPRPPKPPPPAPRAGEAEPPKPPKDDSIPGLIVDVKIDPKKDAPIGTISADLATAYIQLARLASGTVVPQSQMNAALQEYRAAKLKSDQELAAARGTLRDLVTTRQEMILVVMGILE